MALKGALVATGTSLVTLNSSLWRLAVAAEHATARFGPMNVAARANRQLFGPMNVAARANRPLFGPMNVARGFNQFGRLNAPGRLNVAGGPMALADGALIAARSIDQLATSITNLAPAGGPADRNLADLIKRGQAPELVDAVRRALGLTRGDA